MRSVLTTSCLPVASTGLGLKGISVVTSLRLKSTSHAMWQLAHSRCGEISRAASAPRAKQNKSMNISANCTIGPPPQHHVRGSNILRITSRSWKPDVPAFLPPHRYQSVVASLNQTVLCKLAPLMLRLRGGLCCGCIEGITPPGARVALHCLGA